MYTVTLNQNKETNLYISTLISSDTTHYLNIYVSKELNDIWVSISKSEDGFNFRSPCTESNNLNFKNLYTFDEIVQYIKKHFLEKDYKFYIPKST